MPTTPTTDPLVPAEPVLGRAGEPGRADARGDRAPGARGAPGLPRRGLGILRALHEVVGERPMASDRIRREGSRDHAGQRPSRGREHASAFRLIEVVAEELEIPSRSLGSTTWMRPAIRRGIEADESFYFSPEKLAAVAAARCRRRQWTSPIYPESGPGDRGRYLGAEGGSAGHLRRTPGGGDLAVQRTRRDHRATHRARGLYADAGRSGFLPVCADEVARWVLPEDRSDLAGLEATTPGLGPRRAGGSAAVRSASPGDRSRTHRGPAPPSAGRAERGSSPRSGRAGQPDDRGDAATGCRNGRSACTSYRFRRPLAGPAMR